MTFPDPAPAFAAADSRRVIPVRVLDRRAESPLATLDPRSRDHAQGLGWRAIDGKPLLVPGSDGTLECVLFPLDPRDWRETGKAFPFGSLPRQLPASVGDEEIVYRIEGLDDAAEMEFAALGWLLGSYRYRNRSEDGEPAKPDARLLAPASIDPDRLLAIATGVWLARRLVDTPANLLGPKALAAVATQLAERFGAHCTILVDDEEIRENWPLVHAVGRAGAEAPRVVDLRWGEEDAPRITLVGKGVTFDSGGLDIKPPGAMRLMKKDMGGGAVALGLAYMVMAQNLPCRLRLLLPIAENMIAANAYRPGDVLTSRSGKTVEVGDTDAEGRLLLADALTEADSESPDLLLDFATLTGAARVALGPDLPALFAPSDALAGEILDSAMATRDPVWRLPLWGGYDSLLRSEVADLSSTGADRFGGAITAALFLQRFIGNRDAWAHLDLYAWNPRPAPGRPKGGECQAARALFDLIERRLRQRQP